jgi:predicted nucleic acid-binding protein
MSHIFDASVLEEVLRPAPNDAPVMLLAEGLLRAQRFYLAATSIGEIHDSIFQMSPLEADHAEHNLGLLLGLLSSTRILNFDAGVAREWGKLRFELGQSSHLPNTEELLVAAVAKRYFYTIVTIEQRDWHFGTGISYEYIP